MNFLLVLYAFSDVMVPDYRESSTALSASYSDLDELC